MKQYKGFKGDNSCRGMVFEVGKTYSVEGELVMCKNGFHTCNTLWEVALYYYAPQDSNYAEVEATVDIQGDNKNCSRTITVIRWLTFYEVMRLLNSNADGSPYTEKEENENLGFFNWGNNNNGNSNLGNFNQGNDI